MRVFTGLKTFNYQNLHYLAQLVFQRTLRLAKREGKGGISLTANQLKYADLKETQRKNRVAEQLATQTLAETKRHNVQAEAAGMMSAGAAATTAQAQVPYYKASADKIASEVGVAAAKQEEEVRWHDLQDWYNRGKLKLESDQIDLGVENLDELIRHNQVSEDISRWRARFENAESVGHVIRDALAGGKSLSDIAAQWLVSPQDVLKILSSIASPTAKRPSKSNRGDVQNEG